MTGVYSVYSVYSVYRWLVIECVNSFHGDISRQIAVEWHQPSHEEGLRYQLQQRHEAEGVAVGGAEGAEWSNIYSDKNNYFILPAISRGESSVNPTGAQEATILP